MTPRLMVVCLGGLAGGGGLVCCDLDEGVEDPAAVDGEVAEAPVVDAEADAEGAVH